MNECDFIPARYHEERSLRRSIRMRASGIGVMLFIMVLWGVVHQRRLAGAEAMLQEVSQQRHQVELNAAKKGMMDSQLTTLRNRRRLIENLADRVHMVPVFSDLSRRQPESVVLTSLTIHCSSIAAFDGEEMKDQRTSKIAKTGPNRDQKTEKGLVSSPSKSTLILSGIAVSLPKITQFAATLEESPLFDGVSLSVKDPTVWAGHRAESFEMRCELIPQQRGRP